MRLQQVLFISQLCSPGITWVVDALCHNNSLESMSKCSSLWTSARRLKIYGATLAESLHVNVTHVLIDDKDISMQELLKV